MKAVLLMGYGGVEQLELTEVPDTKPGPGEVKVSVAATSVNPIDWKLRSGFMRGRVPLQFPARLGADAAGTVMEVGSDVGRLRVGARVAGLVSGGYAERVVAKEDAWAMVPETLDLVDAAAVPLVALTGAQLIEDAVRAHAGQIVLVTGAVGSVGRVAVFVAKSHGATVWAGVRGAQRGAAAQLGADRVVAIDDEVECAALPELDAVADTVGGPTLQRLLVKIRPTGVVGTVLSAGAPGAVERGLDVRATRARSDPERLGALFRAVADGSLTLPIAKRFSLSDVREAQRLAESGAAGKVVLRV